MHCVCGAFSVVSGGKVCFIHFSVKVIRECSVQCVSHRKILPSNE